MEDRAWRIGIGRIHSYSRCEPLFHLHLSPLPAAYAFVFAIAHLQMHIAFPVKAASSGAVYVPIPENSIISVKCNK